MEEVKNNLDIWSKIKFNRIILDKIKFERMKEVKVTSPEDMSLEIKYDYEIEEINDGELTIIATSKVYFSPVALLSIELEHTLYYDYEQEISEKDIKDNIGKLLIPCGNSTSLVVAQITDRVADSPMIIPPKVIIKDDNDEN